MQDSWSARERQHVEAVALYDLVAAAGMPIGGMEAAALSTLPADWAALQAAIADAVAEHDQEVAACQRELDCGVPPVHADPAIACRTGDMHPGCDARAEHHLCWLREGWAAETACCMQRRSLRARR